MNYSKDRFCAKSMGFQNDYLKLSFNDLSKEEKKLLLLV